MGNLLTIKFWLNSRPGPLMEIYHYYFIIFIVILAISAFILFILSRKRKSFYKRIWQSLYFFSFINAIIGLILLWFAYEIIPFLSARIGIAFWLIVMIVWLFLILKRLKEIPKRKQELEKEKEFKKYIP